MLLASESVTEMEMRLGFLWRRPQSSVGIWSFWGVIFPRQIWVTTRKVLFLNIGPFSQCLRATMNPTRLCTICIFQKDSVVLLCWWDSCCFFCAPPLLKNAMDWNRNLLSVPHTEEAPPRWPIHQGLSSCIPLVSQSKCLALYSIYVVVTKSNK